MPIEFVRLKDKPQPMLRCPKCGYLFVAFMRGQVQNRWRKWLRRPYCCLICSKCKEIVGYEDGQ